ncbi:DUF882 domain-containing protein [Pendulispora albinea]|uniref:Murein endopeptidase K n=1 Tax=Pendulispora albinea TaxID=2741071 RepID=A0ABZ2LXP3_9BACT
MRIAVLAWSVLATSLCVLSSVPARADVKHVVARGHTLDAIARRYHVPQKAIIDANHLHDPKHLRVGETLVIPGVQAPQSASQQSHTGAPATTKGAGDKAKAGKPQKPPTYAMAPRTPGVIHASRLATSEDFTIRVADRRGRTSPTALKSFERLLRSAGNQSHAIEPRLVALVGVVSNHFGSRKLEVISGFRPYSPTQHTAHSNHNAGKAIDFRVLGVPNEVLRDFCRTLKNVGVGYYPNSTFVHLDVRALPAYWIDYSKPGEPPRYNSPNVEADEGTSDVGAEIHAALGSDPASPSTGSGAGASDAGAAPTPPAASSTP